jgi:DnaJ-class molecular chaperone
MAMSEPKKVCNTCGGSGEIGYFKGESRFFITREECPACVGLGYVLEDLNPDGNPLEPDMENRGEGE